MTMNKLIYFFILIATGYTLSSCSASRKSEPVVGRTFIASSERVKHGQELFMMNCEKCHPGGEAGVAPAINWNPAPAFIKKFQVRHGLGVMPSFKENEISESDLKDIIAYLKARKKF
jgi:mono/diheme cytochrome c family protein